jgi:hypothetical protein
MIESLKIILASIGAAILYGIVHDQFTARICIEYFTVFHPPVFATQSPTLQGLGWGIIATWWVGAFLGVMLAIAARAGSQRTLQASQLLTPIAKLLLVMATCALIFGIVGFVLATHQIIYPPVWVSSRLSPSRYSRFMADWWAHNASYASGFIGGIALSTMTYRKRNRPQP